MDAGLTILITAGFFGSQDVVSCIMGVLARRRWIRRLGAAEPPPSFSPENVVVREAALPPRAFVFVEVGHFAEPIHHRAVIVNNVTIINETVNITKITRVNNVVVNNGPRVDVIEKVSSRKLTVPPPRVAVDHRNADNSADVPKNVKPRDEETSTGR